MSVIKAPFNFVPLSKTVVVPEWGPYISHDIPFEDAQSGKLEVILEAHSPVFVRDGDKTEGTQVFSQTPGGKYFIPGSSLRGMLRNVMEIMTFSKMGRVNDHRFAYRDFHNTDLYNILNISKGVKAGWLYKRTTDYMLIPCGVPGRVSLNEVDQAFGTSLKNFFSVNGGFDGNNDEHKSAKYKYQMIGNQALDVIVRKAPPPPPDKFNKYDLRKKYVIVSKANRPLDTGERQGTLVLTGQPDARKEPANRKPSGKLYEFVFWDTNKDPVPVPPSVIEDMHYAYLDDKKDDEQSVDWKYWKAKLNQHERIPVFYHEGKDGTPESMGLSFLYKFAFKHSVPDLIERHQEQRAPQGQKADMDLTEAILGYTRLEENKDAALKGRVHIGHAQAVGNPQAMGPKMEVLAGPKASYYPLYVQQDQQNGRVGTFKTYDDDDACIAGWKRYPVRVGSPISNPPSNKVKNPEKVSTTFVPLDKGARFRFTVAYHNLNLIELGALISTLRFHATEGAFHSLGMAKPLGYGKVSLTIEELGVGDQETHFKALKAFEAYMCASLEKGWARSPEMTELINMASEQEAAQKDLGYMNLDKGAFSDVKKNKEALKPYSEWKQVETKHMTSWISDDDISRAMAEKEKREALYARKRAYKVVMASYLEEKRREFSERLEAHKAKLLQAIRARKATLEAERAKLLKQQAVVARKEEGPDLDSKKLAKSKRPVYDMRQVLEVYFKRTDNEAKRLAPEHVPAFKEKFLEICGNVKKKKDRQALLQEPWAANEDFQQVVIWIGEEETTDLWKKIQALFQ